MTVELDRLTEVVPGASVEWEPVRWPGEPAQQSAAGRRAAAAALASAGSNDLVVPRGRDGRPRFPEGFPGSISHTGHLAVAAVVPRSTAVGVDIEDAAIGPRVTEFVLRERERRALLAPAGQHTARELFAAKEAGFKALQGAATQDFLFWQVELGRSGGVLVASYRGVSARVWVRSGYGLAFAVAIRW